MLFLALQLFVFSFAQKVDIGTVAPQKNQM